MVKSSVEIKISLQLPKYFDYLLVCASFEDRCLSMYEYIDQTSVSKTGIFYFQQFSKNSSCNLAKLKTKFKAETFGLDYSNPTNIADALMDFLKDLESNQQTPNIVIDISTFTRESLLIILRYLLLNAEYFNGIYLFYRYASVSSYLSSGVSSIRSVLGFIGDISIDRSTHLIILSGFEHERAKEIIDTLEPDFISIGYGSKDSSITSELHALNKEFTDKLIAYYSGENIHVFEHSLKNPVTVKKEVLKLAHQKPEYNTVVVPLNNKISMIGVALAANENSAIQLIYAQVNEYNETSYSRIEDDCLIFDLKRLIE